MVTLVAISALVFLTSLPAVGSDYEIGPGDVLKVTVLGQAEMSGNFTVDPEGLLTYPILGKLKAAEMTTAELERKLTTLLADGYLKRPQVSVIVAEFGSQKVFVTGEVQKPGQYALKADRSLLALLSDLGPLGQNVGHEVVVVRPPTAFPPGPGAAEPVPSDPAAGAEAKTPAEGESSSSTPPTTQAAASGKAPAPEPTPSVPGLPYIAPGSEIIHISLLELQSGNPEKNITLQAGDTIYFPKASQVYVMGSVARPGPYRYEEGMTVLQALMQAGGATDRGSAGRTKVIRIEKGKKIERKVKPTELVQPEDTLFVPERFF